MENRPEVYQRRVQIQYASYHLATELELMDFAEFRFPFGRVGKVVDTRNMSTLGRNLDLQPREVHDIAFLGRPRVDMREMAAMKRYSVKRGDLMRVPCAPGKLLKAAA